MLPRADRQHHARTVQRKLRPIPAVPLHLHLWVPGWYGYPMRASASQTRSALAAVFIIRAGLAGAVLSLVGCAGQPPAVGMYTRSGIVPLYTLAEPPPPAYSMPPGIH